MIDPNLQVSDPPKVARVDLPSATLRLLGTLGTLALLALAGLEFGRIAWGTGDWLGKLSLKWGLALAVFGLMCGVILASILAMVWWPSLADRVGRLAARGRARLGPLRFLVMGLAALTPAWLLLHTRWGEIFPGFFLRLLLFLGTVAVVGWLSTQRETLLIGWTGALTSFVLVGAVFVLAKALAPVIAYPFSLSWSEGNRMWDYSVLFGSRIYDYPPGEPIFAYIDRGRQALWGLPFLLPQVSIVGVRLWSALLFTVPYALLGWMAFRPRRGRLGLWVLCGLWTLVFLNQGPIYTPLVLSAILVAGALRRPLWLALPLIALAGYYAQLSRFTWLFAPAMWAGMVALARTARDGLPLRWRDWALAGTLGIAGVLGGLIIPRLGAGLPGEINEEIASVSGVTAFLSRQPLLWSRLWPNPTNSLGIVLGLLLAAGPLVALLVYLVIRRHWPLNPWQRLGLLLPLLAFLGVGLVASVKIGGGSNLHNLDMFLIGLVFTAALAWEAGADRMISDLENQPTWMRLALLLIVAIPAFPPLLDAEPLKLPAPEVSQSALEVIQAEVADAKSRDEVLFMDQRQLLTFGYVQDVPLVPDYEKKYLMDQALSSEAAYFERFYADLARHRFALIISHPIKVQYQGSTHNFGEENDAWSRWVAEAILCYYEPKMNLNEDAVQLLIPRASPGEHCPE